LRTDQLMSFAWKFMLPMTLVNIVVAAVWHLTINVPGGVLTRWIICGLLLAIPYVLLGRAFELRTAKRTYRYAE
jgi:NADH-quinone oxidoreductase subunit H